jgi:acyl-coenzyme A thioesterase PaaI-like protein
MPLSDFGSHDPDFSAEQVAQCARIVEGVREISTKVVRLAGPLGALTTAADGVEALSASLDAVTGARAMETFRFQFDLGDPNAIMPFNPATGAFNPVAPKLEMRVEGERLVSEVVFAARYESSPDSVQGGMVSALYDQLLAFAVMIHGKTGPSVTLEVKFLARTPIGEPLRFETWVERIDGDRYHACGVCRLGDTPITEARGEINGKYDLPVVGTRPARPDHSS